MESILSEIGRADALPKEIKERPISLSLVFAFGHGQLLEERKGLSVYLRRAFGACFQSSAIIQSG